MSTTVTFKNKFNGKIKQVKLGYSWTTFFFAFFPDLFRAHWFGFGVGIGIWVLSIITAGFGWIGFIIYGFFRNKQLVKHYDTNGWEITDGDIAKIEAYIGQALLNK